MEKLNTSLTNILDFDCYDSDKKNKLVTIAFADYEQAETTQKTYFQLHQHEDSQLIVLIKGHGEVFFNNESYPIHDGQLSILDPHFAHSDKLEDNHSCFFLAIKNCTFRTQFDNLIVDISENIQSYYFYLYKIVEELSNKRKGYRQFVRALFQCFISQLSRDYVQKKRTKQENEATPPPDGSHCQGVYPLPLRKKSFRGNARANR